jgi:hypothetical protein
MAQAHAEDTDKKRKKGTKPPKTQIEEETKETKHTREIV